MKFNNYQEYVEASKEHFKYSKLTVPVELMILSENIFNHFDGVIEFGAGAKQLLNQKSKCNGNCNCSVKCAEHLDK